MGAQAEGLKKYGGIFAALFSAFIFGAAPILAMFAYEGGSNSIMFNFTRVGFGIPVLFVILLVKKIPIGITIKELKDVIIVGAMGAAATQLLLYESYNYISVGMATTLHFIYPVWITLCGMLFFKERAGIIKMLALVIGVVGIALFFEGADSTGFAGIFMALLSGITYTVYAAGVERTSLKKMHFFKLSFYICVVCLFVSGIFGVFTSQITIEVFSNMTGEAWIYSFIGAILLSVCGITLFQHAITLIGATTTAIMSTLEPITGVVAGLIFLSESITAIKLVGCGLICASVLVVTFAQVREQRKQVKKPSGGSMTIAP